MGTSRSVGHVGGPAFIIGVILSIIYRQSGKSGITRPQS